ncbi:helix-turn-helix domain-containing protein [Paenibacillus tundrae]|uniref:helix-turn-helix domain-containing protein n=1 Tax=Paenibacillus tundrae TaxID=528187 RepID=UPI0030D1887A
MEVFAQRLKNEREEMKKKSPIWTQEYVAKILGVARPTYTAYENGTKQPPMDTMNKIADLFGVNVDYLYGRSNIRETLTLDNELKAKFEFFEDLEKRLGLDLSDPAIQKKLKRAAQIIFSEED